MALKLSLKPDEVIFVNGALLRNGKKRTTLLVENQARILRSNMMPDGSAPSCLASLVHAKVVAKYASMEKEKLVSSYALAELKAYESKLAVCNRTRELLQNSVDCLEHNRLFAAISALVKLRDVHRARNGDLPAVGSSLAA